MKTRILIALNLVFVFATMLFATVALAREPEPRPQDWTFHVWMAKVAELAQQRGVTIEDTEPDFIAYWEEASGAEEVTPEGAIDRFEVDRELADKNGIERQTKFDKWWEELKAVSPAFGYSITEEDEESQMEYFWHHGFPEGQTPGEAIVAAQERDALRDIKEAQESVFVQLEKQAALAHGLTEEETETFLDWSRWQRDENAETPHAPHATSGEEMFEAWQHNLEENECGP